MNENAQDYVQEYTQKLYSYIQERYLWQFHSRIWDREANINGILNMTGQLLTSEVVAMETPADRCYYADAAIFAGDIKKKFAGFLELNVEAIKDVMGELKVKLLQTMVEKSLNAEVRNPNY